jgi:TolB-like protein
VFWNLPLCNVPPLLSQRVRVLRESIGDLAENPRYIAAVRGWGYRLIAPVERFEAPAIAEGAIHSLAVLPLTNITCDSQLEYFADGMTESLISALAKISALKVISRTSVMAYKDTKKKAPQIARELGVDAVIEGTVLVTKERVRVSARNYARINEVDKAMECLEQCYMERDGIPVLLKAFELWDSLRSDPRFQALVRRVGIP